MASGTTGLECPTCTKCFPELKRLTCNHTFCVDCLTKRVQEEPSKYWTVECCKRITEIGEQITDLPNEFTVTSLRNNPEIQEKLLVQDIKCRGCYQHEESLELKQAISGCTDCNHFLCEKCNSAHETMLIFKSHKVSTLVDLLSEVENVAGQMARLQMSDPDSQGTFIKCESGEMCEACEIINKSSCFFGHKTSELFKTIGHIDCGTSNVLFLISCKKCTFQYVGKTTKLLKNRISELKSIKDSKVAKHFKSAEHDVSHMILNGIETWDLDVNSSRTQTEWIKLLVHG